VKIKQILSRPDFTSGVPNYRHPRVLWRHSGAIVRDDNPLSAAVLKLNADFGGTSVDSVLKKFFNNTGGPLNDLAGRDLIDEILV
jgi:hypothetical protein